MEADGPDTIADGGPSLPVDDLQEEAAALIGVDVGGYVIDGELGRGGMGVVFSATHPVIGKRAAIKVLKPSLSNNPATVERFVQEARSVNQIGHPNIVDIFAYGALPDGRSYLVMDLLQGESLRKRVKRGPLLVGEALHVIDQVASALAAAHDKGFIHRDLKPDNVFLVEHAGRTECKLLDFGLAKLLPTASMVRAYRTATGAQLGTPDYMSPEQLKGPAGVDTRTDVFALGVLAFEILVGERPRRYSDGTFELGGKTISEAIMAKAKPPQELAQLVEAMLALDKEKRPSLAAVHAVLKRARTAVPSTSVIGLEVSIPPVQANVATPRTGLPTVDEGPRERAPSQPPGRGSQPLLRPSTPALSQPRPNQVRVSDAETNPGTFSQTPSSPALSANSAAGLRPAASTHGGTKLGVAPPGERPSKPHPVALRAMTGQPSGGGRTWLIVAVVLVVVSA
ncbi:MAG TPA: protein kinase, partial [Kofleriaceae bacterium]|nr:protein kinase [Kofleriaceae bacterium]